MKLLRTLRLDGSDAFVFEKAAEPGQWAVSGAFMFHPGRVDALSAKQRAAFRGGLLGVDDFGWSTLAVAVSVSAEERRGAIEALARGLVARLGAPSIEVARAAAEEEIAFAQSLAEHPEGTIVAVRRTCAGGETTEQFRTLARRPGAPDPLHAGARVFEIVESVDDGPLEEVDLAALVEGRRP